MGHVTATAGIAASNGRAFAFGKYTGVAPDADLIIVKAVSEGAPAHSCGSALLCTGTQPAETAFQGCYTDAFNWVQSQASALHRPLTGLLNAGVQLFGPVEPTHAGGTYTNGNNTEVHFSRASANPATMALWYTGSQLASVSVSLERRHYRWPTQPATGRHTVSLHLPL